MEQKGWDGPWRVRTDDRDEVDVVIVGAGIAALSAWYELQKARSPFVVLEVDYFSFLGGRRA